MPADTIRNGTGHREHVPADVLFGDWEMASGDAGISAMVGETAPYAELVWLEVGIAVLAALIAVNGEVWQL